jgi:hypothetical protein
MYEDQVMEIKGVEHKVCLRSKEGKNVIVVERITKESGYDDHYRKA